MFEDQKFKHVRVALADPDAWDLQYARLHYPTEKRRPTVMDIDSGQGDTLDRIADTLLSALWPSESFCSLSLCM